MHFRSVIVKMDKLTSTSTSRMNKLFCTNIADKQKIYRWLWDDAGSRQHVSDVAEQMTVTIDGEVGQMAT